MFDIKSSNLADGMRNSSNYKVIMNDGWTYVFPILVDFDLLAANINSAEWDRLALVVLDDEGNVCSHRYGVVKEL